MRNLTSLFILLFIGCTSESSLNLPSPFSHIKDKSVKNILEKAIAQSGGWEAFQNMDSIFYEKRTVLFDSLGNVESDRTQKHSYQLKPDLVMSISWENEDRNHLIFRDKNGIKKEENGERLEADETALLRTTNAATYTMFMPWKLLDPGVELKYKGVEKMPDGISVHVIGANYDPATKNNHSTNDDWEYYFDEKTYDYAACMVDHHDYFAFIKNEKKSKAGGLTFNAFRNSYRVDGERNILWKRGEFYYENIIVK